MSRVPGVPLTPRDRRVLRLGGWVVGAALTLRLLAGAADAMRARLDTVARERELLAREMALVRQATHDRALLDRARLALASTAPRLFDGSDAVTAAADMARHVSAQVVRSGLTLLETETVLEDPTVLRVVIRARGTAAAIATFLRAIEGGTKLIRVDRFSIGTASDGALAGGGTLAFTATLAGSATRGGLP